MRRAILPHRLRLKRTGHRWGMDIDRYGDLTDEFEQMHSAEGAVPDGSVLVVGPFSDLLSEFVKYLVTRN